MKNVYRISALIIAAVIAAISFTGCAKKDDPKALAKQSYDLSKEIIASVSDLDKAEKLTKEAVVISEKVDKLSSTDRVTYNFELARLAKSDAGFLLQDLSGAVSGLDLSELQNALNSADAQGVMSELQNSLNSADVQSLLNELQGTLSSEEIQGALDGLKSLF